MELSCPAALDRIGPHGMIVEVTARPHDLAPIAARLQVPSVSRLECTFRLRRIGSSLIEAEGALRAAVEQVCVASLDTFVQDISDDFTVHFVPAGTEEDDPEPDSVDQIPYAGSVIDLGEVAVEQLALVLDPYPRKPGVTWSTGAEDGADGMFAALAGLRTRPQ